MDVESSSQRVRILKLAFQKAIAETFKEKDAVKATLLSDGRPNKNTLSEDSNQRDDAYNNLMLDSLFEDLFRVSQEVFKSKLASNKVAEKLENLDKLVKENRRNLRDIKSREYIREIYESYLVENKIELYSRIEEVTLKARQRKNEVRARNEKLMGKLEDLRTISDGHEKKFRALVETLNISLKPGSI